MVIPFLIPAGIAVASAVGGAAVAHGIAKKREEKLEDALAEAMVELPAEKQEKVSRALDPVRLERIKGKAVGLRRRAEEEAKAKGTKEQEKIAPSTVKGFGRMGLVTPMGRLGGWR